MNKKGEVDFFNESAAAMIGVSIKEAIGKNILDIIPTTRLPHVFRTGESETNRKQTLANGLKIVTSRYALVDEQGNSVGSFAIFKDITEVVALAEEITDLKKVQTMLQAIIHSSDDAISVVDENGNGILVNPAYTRLTGLTEEEVIGKPATADISEGESIHMLVLRTRKAVRGVNMRVGDKNKEVIVNVAPIIVDDEIKGSVGVIHDLTEIRSLTSELDQALSIIRKLESAYTFEDVYGSSKEINISIEMARLAAGNDVPVLLRGEIGSGKELFAHAIHSESDRKLNKFIRVNCSAIDPVTLEAKLFGSGDLSEDKGLFRETANGTLFLDEIADLSHSIQSKLLDYLKEGMVYSNPADNKESVAVRFITASSKNLEKAMLEGSFIEELYYMLSRMSIQIPSLRVRREDILEISNQLLIKLNKELGMNIENISKEAKEKLQSYEWPGNVRELENVLSRALIYMDSSRTVLEFDDVNKSLAEPDKVINLHLFQSKNTLAILLDDYEKTILVNALQENNNNKSVTANKLGISLRSLYYKLEKFDLI